MIGPDPGRSQATATAPRGRATRQDVAEDSAAKLPRRAKAPQSPGGVGTTAARAGRPRVPGPSHRLARKAAALATIVGLGSESGQGNSAARVAEIRVATRARVPALARPMWVAAAQVLAGQVTSGRVALVPVIARRVVGPPAIAARVSGARLTARRAAVAHVGVTRGVLRRGLDGRPQIPVLRETAAARVHRLGSREQARVGSATLLGVRLRAAAMPPPLGRGPTRSPRGGPAPERRGSMTQSGPGIGGRRGRAATRSGLVVTVRSGRRRGGMRQSGPGIGGRRGRTATRGIVRQVLVRCPLETAISTPAHARSDQTTSSALCLDASLRPGSVGTSVRPSARSDVQGSRRIAALGHPDLPKIDLADLPRTGQPETGQPHLDPMDRARARLDHRALVRSDRARLDRTVPPGTSPTINAEPAAGPELEVGLSTDPPARSRSAARAFVRKTSARYGRISRTGQIRPTSVRMCVGICGGCRRRAPSSSLGIWWRRESWPTTTRTWPGCMPGRPVARAVESPWCVRPSALLPIVQVTGPRPLRNFVPPVGLAAAPVTLR